MKSDTLVWVDVVGNNVCGSLIRVLLGTLFTVQHFRKDLNKTQVQVESSLYMYEGVRLHNTRVVTTMIQNHYS